MKKVALHNLGCKVNSYETDAMQELLEQNGYQIVPFKEGADIYIINTCTVTNMADRKSRQMLHKAKKMNPDAVVIAAGCYVQVRDGAEVDESIDLIIGNNKKNELIQILNNYFEQRENHTNTVENITENTVIDLVEQTDYENLQISKTTEHTRAYLKVQDGCNQFCSYCVIPFARGRIRSRRLEDVLVEVETLAKNGYQEVVLTGIHLSSYGVDLTGQRELLQLITTVHQVDGIQRIRLGSLEPRIITEEFVKHLVKLPKVCAHFHLSLQSGCDTVLRRMNRKYTSQEYLEACQLLRAYYDRVMFTTDIIVGFPGETEEEFQVTKKFVEKIGFYETHIFKYSKREGTKAASMENQVDERIKAQRSAEMIQLNEKSQRKIDESLQGIEVSVLLEEEIRIDEKQYLVGHTQEYVKIAVLVDTNKINKIIYTTIGANSQIIH